MASQNRNPVLLSWMAKEKGWATNVMMALAAFLMTTAGCQSNKAPFEDTLPFYADGDFTPQWIDQDSHAYQNIHTIAPFTFTNQDGETVTEKTFEGKIYVADFFFATCPGICPTMTRNMGKVQDDLKNDDDVLILSHSVTPETDTVPVLKHYANENGITSGKWHLVTGERKAIYSLARTSYFAEEDLGLPVNENDFLHTENMLLIDKQRHIRGIYKGTFPVEMTRLMEDIQILNAEG